MDSISGPDRLRNSSVRRTCRWKLSAFRQVVRPRFSILLVLSLLALPVAFAQEADKAPPAPQTSTTTDGMKEDVRKKGAPDQASQKIEPGKSTEPAKIIVPAQSTAAAGPADSDGVPLLIDGQEVFRIRAKLGPFTPKLRVEAIGRKLHDLEDRNFKASDIKTTETSFSTDIVAGDTIIMTVTDPDVQAEKAKSRQELADKYATLLRAALERQVESRSLPNLLLRVGLSILATVAFCLFLGICNWSFPALYRGYRSLKGTFIKSLKFQQAVLLSEDTVIDLGIGLFRLLRLSVVLSALAVYLTTVLGFFPQTRALSDSLLHSLTWPILSVAWPAVVSYAPNLVFIVTIAVCSYYLIGFTRYIFAEISRGTISFPSFDPDWADPTYKIARFLLIAFSIVLIFPYLPGSGSPAFQQVSLFLGILISLGSSGAMAHIIAGIFLTYTGAFKVGDRVKIADTVGDVIEKTLLATRIRTIKQEFITIPNGLVLSSHIINYSHSSGASRLILHTTVTIGYDVPWRQVHELLISAASATANIVSEPAPFVYQTSLDDYYVSYQINASTDKPHMSAETYSRLHQNIQDRFNEAGVEIMSPQYSSVRDGNHTTVPSKHLPPDYAAPTFGVHMNAPVNSNSSDSHEARKPKVL